MTTEKVLSIIWGYKQLFVYLGIPAKSCDRDSRDLNVEAKLAHCHRMLEKMPDYIVQGRIEKVMRWLGFIQGTLWALDYLSIDSLKNQSVPDEEKKK